MKRQKMFRSLLCLTLLLALLLAGCGNGANGEPTAAATDAPAAADPYEGYYKTYVTSSIATMNFLVDASSNTGSQLMGRTSLHLYAWFPDGEGYANLEGELAAEDPICMDSDTGIGSVWQIKLRQNAKWANGDPITADDVIFTAQTALDPAQLYRQGVRWANNLIVIQNGTEYVEQYAPGNSPVAWEDVGIKKIDDYTIEITTAQPTTALKIKQHFVPTSTSLIHKATYESCWNASRTVNSYGSSLDKWMSAGEYIMTEWVTDSKYVLTKNPDYVRADLIKLEGIVYRVVPDNNTALQMFLNGELHQAALGSADIQSYIQDPRYMSEPPTQLMNININNRNTDNNGILNNLNFRKALFYATDRESIAALRNTIPATYILGTKMIIDGSGTTFRSLESSQSYLAENYGYDPEYAKECFDLAMQECGLETLNLTVIFSESSPNQRPIAEYVQKSWREIFGDSFSLELDPKPSSVAYAERKGWTTNPNSYELAIEGYVPDETILTDAVRMYTTGQSGANEYNNDPDIDALYLEATTSEKAFTDNDYLISLVQEIERQAIYENYITCPVFEMPSAWLVSEDVVLAVNDRVPSAGWMLDFAELVPQN